MAMVVKNNMSSVSTLNTLNKNNNEMAKSLKKVSSGMKVNGAGDDASAYSISERMRVQIRSLGQCENNTETGKSMLKTAERAVNEQVDITKRLKENALKAANDTCTDDDRRIIQKETNHLLMQMNDISYETNYNGIQLLNGRTVIGEYKPEFIPRVIDGDKVADSAQNAPGIDIIPPGTATSNTWKDSQGNAIVGYGLGPKGGQNVQETLPLKLDFPNLPDSLHGQGFSALCNGCTQFASILFDANTDKSVYASGTVNNKKAEVYVIGIKNCKSANAVGDAIMKGLMEAQKNPNPSNSAYSGQFDTAHGIKIKKSTTSPTKYYIDTSERTNTALQVIYNGVCGDVEYSGGALPYKNLMIQGATKSSQETRVELPNTTLDVLFPGAPIESDWQIEPKNPDYPKEWASDFIAPGSSEFEYYDKKYGCNGDIEAIRRAKWYDEVWPYPRKGASANGSCLTTIPKANKFMEDVDQALKYLLHCATNLGAQCQRMDVMNANLVTSDESTQASESLIRDADMAKEMVGYEKNNILTQTAQSALAQANQTSSGILNILK